MDGQINIMSKRQDIFVQQQKYDCIFFSFRLKKKHTEKCLEDMFNISIIY